MDEQILVQKSLLQSIFNLLQMLDYEDTCDDGDTAQLKAEISLDWFYYVKNHLEKVINEN